jgi:hypothetical protein
MQCVKENTSVQNVLFFLGVNNILIDGETAETVVEQLIDLSEPASSRGFNVAFVNLLPVWEARKIKKSRYANTRKMVAEVEKCNELLANSTLRSARQFTPDNSKGNDTLLAPLTSVNKLMKRIYSGVFELQSVLFAIANQVSC